MLLLRNLGLIGVIVKDNGLEKNYSFWANNENEEKSIFIEFITLLQSLNDFKIYHYGSYEIQALKTISKKISPEYHDFVKNKLSQIENIGVLNSTFVLKEIKQSLGYHIE